MAVSASTRTAPPARVSAVGPSDGVARATGQTREAWFAALDAWGAKKRSYREIAAWLVTEQGLSRWWAQKLAVEYEQARGVRAPGVRPDGTFTVTASKTVSVPASRLLAAFVDPKIRGRWIRELALRRRTSAPGRSARFDRVGTDERVLVTVEAVGRGKSRVAVEHARLVDAATAGATKAFWRERLGALKTMLEP